MGHYNYGWQEARNAKTVYAMQRKDARRAGTIEAGGLVFIDGWPIKTYQVWYKGRRKGQPMTSFEEARAHLAELQGATQ